jgi:hypothetical protein
MPILRLPVLRQQRLMPPCFYSGACREPDYCRFAADAARPWRAAAHAKVRFLRLYAICPAVRARTAPPMSAAKFRYSISHA